MCDFLVSLDKRYRGEDLLNLLKRPYRNRAPGGSSYDFTWGSVAVLEDHLAYNNNIIERNGVVLAWVGDLVTDMSNGYIDALISRIGDLRGNKQHEVCSLESDEVFKKLNGAFAILLTDNNGLSIVTDPLNFTPVFMGRKKGERIAAFGSHPDLVASISGNSSKLDTVSVAEFLNIGTPSFPHTMYQNVEELEAGSLLCISFGKNRKTTFRSSKYWSPPEEQREEYNENDLAEELRRSFLSAVRDRCQQGRAAVLLSGGLDSRLITASVPSEADCIALTFCDRLNRETQIAQKAAKCYGITWYPLFRDKEYVGNNIIGTIRLTGCEYDWIHAHSIGFYEEIKKLKINALFNGAWVGCFLRAPLAEEFVRVNRLGGILPAKYTKKPVEYVDRFTAFFRKEVREDIMKKVYERRQNFFEGTLQAGRGSPKEWLDENPITQRPEICCWNIERRLFPSRAVAMDKRILNVAFKCPVELKLDHRFFNKAAMPILGRGARIPNANDGVKPDSGHWSRLVQRAIRKFQDRTTNILEKLGKEPKIQHSWHDYQKYWRESAKLDELREQYGANLDQFDGILFKESGRALLNRKDIDWRYGFRLIQLAVWLGIKENYTLVPKQNLPKVKL